MASVVLVVVVVLLTWVVVSFVRSRRHGLEAKRGLSIGADLGILGDTPRVTVRAVAPAGTGMVLVVLAPEIPGADIDLVVELSDDDFRLDLLHEWQRAGNKLAFVMPPDSHIVRLRSIDDLQPLTLRRVDTE